MRTQIKDASGNLKYSIDVKSSNHKVIYDKCGNLLGTIRNGWTYDKTGKLVSQGEDISALMM
jgi:hypothetical protein